MYAIRSYYVLAKLIRLKWQLRDKTIDDLIAAVDYVREIKRQEARLHGQVLRAVHRVEGKITIPQMDGFEVLDISQIV